MTEVHATIDGFRQALRALRARGTVAFVPTMGFLHEGHLSLMRLARERADALVVSIFVNPTQFAPGEDLDSYPRDMPRDIGLCEAEGVALIFAPPPGAMYHKDASTAVTVSGMTDNLCGASRPSHFEGVTTIVTKLFNIVQPDVAVFGQKDYQQLAVIRRMVRDLDMPVEIVGGPIVREPDGLAMSSRNVKLAPEARAQAICLIEALRGAKAACDTGERSVSRLIEGARAHIQAHDRAEIDYIEVVHPDSLEALDTVGPEGVVMALAVRFGATRLIDNMRIAQP